MYQFSILTPIVGISMGFLLKGFSVPFILIPLTMALILAIVMNILPRMTFIVGERGIVKNGKTYQWERILHIDYEEKEVHYNRRSSKTFRFLHVKGVDFTITFDVSEIKRYLPRMMEFIAIHRHITMNEMIDNIIYNEKKKQSTEPDSEKWFVGIFAICLLIIFVMFVYMMFLP